VSGGRTLRAIGMGCGPEHLTVEATAALRATGYVIAAEKSDDDPLLDVRRRICEHAAVPLVVVRDPERDRADPADYPGAVRDWHAARAAAYAAVIRERPGDPAFLVWGDPAFYDSTLRIAERLREVGVVDDVESLPGVSALQLLAARHRIVLHEVGRPLLVTTGRRLLEDAAAHDTLVVMLDGAFVAQHLPDLADWQVWWGANLGTPFERVVSGRLDEVRDEVLAARDAARQEAGWVMDTYHLRRRSPERAQ